MILQALRVISTVGTFVWDSEVVSLCDKSSKEPADNHELSSLSRQVMPVLHPVFPAAVPWIQ